MALSALHVKINFTYHINSLNTSEVLHFTEKGVIQSLNRVATYHSPQNSLIFP